MPVLDLHCLRLDKRVEVHFGGSPETRGDPAYRGFACEGEAACRDSGFKCALFSGGGFRPFEPKDALRHLSG